MSLNTKYVILQSISSRLSQLSDGARKMFNLVCYYRVHSGMSSERRTKKRLMGLWRERPACISNEEYVLKALTYASVDESGWNQAIHGPEVGTKCQE